MKAAVFNVLNVAIANAVKIGGGIMEDFKKGLEIFTEMKQLEEAFNDLCKDNGTGCKSAVFKKIIKELYESKLDEKIAELELLKNEVNNIQEFISKTV